MEFKVVVLGDKGVGKTSLVLRFIEGYFIAKQQSTSRSCMIRLLLLLVLLLFNCININIINMHLIINY